MSVCVNSTEIVNQFKVEGLYVVCTTDNVKDLSCKQVLRIWDLLALEDIPILIGQLESIFCKYADDFINFCNEKSLDGYISLHTCITDFMLNLYLKRLPYLDNSKEFHILYCFSIKFVI